MTLLVLLLFLSSLKQIQALCDKECSGFGLCLQSVAGRMFGHSCYTCVCPVEVGGECCDQTTDLCRVANPCDPKESCTMQKNGRAKCTSSWCNEEPCRNGGECSAAGYVYATSCICKNGFTGKYCEYPLECAATTRTKRFIGSVLEFATGAKDNEGAAPAGFQPPVCFGCEHIECENGGYCLSLDDGDFRCMCEKGFTGEFCEHVAPCADPTKNLCKNGGDCIADPEDPLKEACRCLSVWKGERCEEYDPCYRMRDTCINGKCHPVGPHHSFCSCHPGYEGEWCEVDIDECLTHDCKHNSTCEDKVNDYFCHCLEGTNGTRCEINPDDCGQAMVGNFERNHCNKKDRGAQCIDGFNDFKCVCSPDVTGKLCDMTLVIWYVTTKFNATGEELQSLFQELLDEPTLVKDIIPFFLALLPPERQMESSWEHEDLFEWASFEGAELDVKRDFVKWNSPTLGNCFTFNHDSSPEKRSLRYAGEREGFRALMRVRQDEYLDWIDTASLLVFVHSSKESVFGESLRFQAKPGGETSLMISQNDFERLGGAYGECIKDKSEVKSYYYEGEYTTDGCLRSCYQDAVFEACGCMDPRFPLKENVDVCPLNERACVQRVSEERGDPSNWPDCRCPLPCSNGQFAVRWSQDNEAFDCREVNASDPMASLCDSKYRDSTMISVYFPELVQICFKEEPKMDLNKFVSNLGGLLGVLMGFSFVTLVEFFYLLVRIVAACFVTK